MASIEFNRNENIAVSTTAVVLSVEKDNANFRRKSIIIINTSATAIITIAIGAEAVAGQGIQLTPGGVWQDSEDSGYQPTQRQITAIANVAGTVALQERTGL